MSEHEFPHSLKQPTKEAIETARGVLARKVDPIEGVHALCGLTHDRSDELNDIATFFSVVSSETEHFPTGDWRLQCAPDYLKKVDQERDEYLADVLPEIDEACRKLIQKLTSEEESD